MNRKNSIYNTEKFLQVTKNKADCQLHVYKKICTYIYLYIYLKNLIFFFKYFFQYYFSKLFINMRKKLINRFTKSSVS